MLNDTNDVAAQQIAANKALFEQADGENPMDSAKALEPTLENLTKALNTPVIESKEYYHVASKMKFKLCPMSSAGYIALNNVEQYNPMTNIKISTNQDDDREREVVYLMHGIESPRITRVMAERILEAPHWGPSNIGLLDAIQEMNPSAEQRLNNFMILMGLSRFLIIWFRVQEETGGFDEICDKINIKDDIKESLRTCIGMFSHLFNIEETSRAWGVPLGIGSLTKPLVNDKEEEPVVEASKVEEEENKDEEELKEE